MRSISEFDFVVVTRGGGNFVQQAAFVVVTLVASLSYGASNLSTLNPSATKEAINFIKGHYMVGLALLEKEKYDEGITELEKAGHPEKMANVWEMLAEKTIFLIIGNASLLGCCLLYHDKKVGFSCFIRDMSLHGLLKFYHL
ncbi:hypothetical protein QQ045_009528 [Rhodiola kirilowii]